MIVQICAEGRAVLGVPAIHWLLRRTLGPRAIKF